MDEQLRMRIMLAASAVSLLAARETAVAGPIQTKQEIFNITLTHGLKEENVYFLFKEDDPKATIKFFSLDSIKIDKPLFDDKAAATKIQSTYSFVTPGDATMSKSLLIVGEYLGETGAPAGIFVGMDSLKADDTIKLGSTFESAFGLNPEILTEFKVEDALQTGNLDVLGLLFSSTVDIAGIKLNTPESLVNFSTASLDGSLLITERAVPEQATLLTFLTGLTGWFGLRRRRQRRRDKSVSR